MALSKRHVFTAESVTEGHPDRVADQISDAVLDAILANARNARVVKKIVEARLARRCEVQVAYAIGAAEPVSVMVDTFGTGALPDRRLEQILREVFDLTPRGIIDTLKLKRPIFSATASYGHFGRKPRAGKYGDKTVELFTWERADRVKDL